MSRRYTRAELRGARLHWLVTVTIRGRRWRFSEVDLDVSDGSDRLHFAGGLEALSYLEQLPEPGAAAETNSASISLLYSGESADGWAALVRSSRGIGAASAELALIRDGDSWANREILLNGAVDNLSYGDFSEPVSFQIEESPWAVASPPFPPPSARVNDSTWPRVGNASTHRIGSGVAERVYPWIVGAPGRGPGGRRFPGSPALLVEIPNAGDNSAADALVLIAGHESAASGASGAIRLYNRSTGNEANLTPTTDADKLGRAVTVVAIGAGDLAITEGDELWVSWADSSGGLIGPRNGAPLRRADDTIAYLIGQSGARALTGARAQIDDRLSYPLAFMINDPDTDPLSIVRAILAYLPASYRVGAYGLEVVRWPFDAEDTDATAEIDIDRHYGARVAGPEVSPISEIVNTIEARYSIDIETGQPIGRVVYAPDRAAADVDTQVNPLCAWSASVYGARAGGAAEFAHVADAEAAAALLDASAARMTQQREYVAYSLPQEFQAIRPGSVVRVSDSAILWSDRLCCVLGVSRGLEAIEMSLVTLPSWIRDSTE